MKPDTKVPNAVPTKTTGGRLQKDTFSTDSQDSNSNLPKHTLFFFFYLYYFIFIHEDSIGAFFILNNFTKDHRILKYRVQKNPLRWTGIYKYDYTNL